MLTSLPPHPDQHIHAWLQTSHRSRAAESLHYHDKPIARPAPDSSAAFASPSPLVATSASTTSYSSPDEAWLLSPAWRRQLLHSKDTLSVERSVMESIHGVDVSWLHHPHKGSNKGLPTTTTKVPSTTPATTTNPSPHSSIGSVQSNGTKALTSSPPQHAGNQSMFPGPVTPAALSEPVKDTTTAMPSTPTPSNTIAKTQSKRPGLLNRNSTEKVGGDGKSLSRRSSWISNISNKFSSSPGTPERPGSHQAQPVKMNVASPAPNGNAPSSPGEEAEPYTPSKPKESSSFFSSLTRKLSAGSQVGGIPKVNGKGGVCERRVLNVDPNRERCIVPEMDQSRLRKVAFCVDVEIAGGPRYRDDEDEDDYERKRRKNDAKVKERAEGEALKNPEAMKEANEQDDETNMESKTSPVPIEKGGMNATKSPGTQQDDVSPSTGSIEDNESISRKKEKKKRSEEERKERKEKRRRRAEENGQIPVELSLDTDLASDLDANTTSASLPDKRTSQSGQTIVAPGSTPSDLKRDKPTTDPVRIYRRCCQLRETPILKRITEQLMSPTCCVPYEPGVVNSLNLTGSRLQLADMITLGDWLAVVPVKRLMLEDADVSDEGLRCILAGLLAAKKPEISKRRSTSPKHREAVHSNYYQERSGMIEKLTLKNNPRLTRIGWKHISLFLYMCRSIKAVDLSMVQFPTTLPASAQATPIRSPKKLPDASGQGTDAAETLFKCLSQRLGGNKLDELILSECGMTAPQIRKIVDAAVICGINRLGFAGNHLDDEGLEAVLHYLRSGVCAGIDIGGNDLRSKLHLVAEALNNSTGVTCWGLGLAGCNLDTASVRPLFPALTKLPNFRFIDLSHNRDLCGQDNGTISLLRRYLGQMKHLKRIHLADVGMSPKQAIALADVLAEGPSLAHLSILDNPQLSALAAAKDEASQEEACALYASYMAAVRVSNTLICIDIDVPSPENSEVVKALAKQVVAYSLRNMERFAIVEATGDAATADAAASLTQAHGGEDHLKNIAVPDVLMHLVGHVEGNSENHDNDEPAPDDDYIVGGTGVVRALQYVLGEKADDLRRTSIPNTPTSGNRTPRDRPDSSAGMEFAEQQVKAKKMSKNLLESARKIRHRLQPALAKEANAGDDMAYRRLLFLDGTLESMIQRFEEEYPETRLPSGSPKAASLDSSATEQSAPLSLNTQITEPANRSDDEDEFDDGKFRPAVSRHNSDVSLASRALAIEEGHLHRLGQKMRRNIVDSPSTATAVEDSSAPWKASEAARLEALREKIESISGPELRAMVENGGWDSALQALGTNANDLRMLQELDPQAWEDFKEAQMKARMNLAQEVRSEK